MKREALFLYTGPGYKGPKTWKELGEGVSRYFANLAALDDKKKEVQRTLSMFSRMI